MVSDSERWILACYVDNLGLTFYRRAGGCMDCVYWAYQDEITHEEILNNLHDECGKTTVKQYTGKRLISI